MLEKAAAAEISHAATTSFYQYLFAFPSQFVAPPASDLSAAPMLSFIASCRLFIPELQTELWFVIFLKK